MAFTTNMSTTTQLDKHILTAMDAEFIISAEKTMTKGLPSLATIKRSEKVKSFEFTIYSKLTRQTSALTEDEDVTSEAMADSSVTITPAEYGKVITTTKLVNLQSGGVPDIAAARLAATNMAESVEARQVIVGEAGTNELIVGQTAESSVTASNVITAAYVKRMFNKLRRAGIQGPYYAIGHNDVIYDLQLESGSQGWTEISNYADPTSVLDNEIGMFGGFHFIDSPLVTINSDAGSGSVDTYHTQFFGYNAFGYAESEAPHGTLTGPFDKLGRFVNIGWMGVYQFGIIDTNAHWILTSASSIGENS